MVVARDGEEGERGVGFNGTEFQFGSMKKALDIDGVVVM